MKFYRLFSLLLLLSIASCKSSLSPLSATWSTWRGGQPGVGGVNYYFVLENKKQNDFELVELSIDGEALTNNRVVSIGDSITISASKSISRAMPTVDNPNPKQESLPSAPASATISGKLKNKNITLEITSFEKGESKSYQ